MEHVRAERPMQHCFEPIVSNFEQVSVESLETAFKFMYSILDHFKLDLDPMVKDRIRFVATRHIHSFLKAPLLKGRVNVKLSVLRAASRLMVKSFTSLDSGPKSTNRLLRETLELMIDAAESCLLSVWRNMRICKELFSCLLSIVSQVAIAGGGQVLPVLLIHLKPLVLAACEHADTSGNSQGTMFESVLRVSCEIIEFLWGKERAHVNTFILGLANCIRERNYEDVVSFFCLL